MRRRYGFSPTGASWLPQPADFGALAADRQDGVAGSTLELYRTALRLRREHGTRARCARVDDGGCVQARFHESAACRC